MANKMLEEKRQEKLYHELENWFSELSRLNGLVKWWVEYICSDTKRFYQRCKYWSQSPKLNKEIPVNNESTPDETRMVNGRTVHFYISQEGVPPELESKVQSDFGYLAGLEQVGLRVNKDLLKRIGWGKSRQEITDKMEVEERKVHLTYINKGNAHYSVKDTGRYGGLVGFQNFSAEVGNLNQKP